MNKKIYKIIIFIIFLSLQSSMNGAYSMVKENYILIKLNNEIITIIDVKNEVSYLEAINKNFRELSQEKKNDIAKESLIRQTIKKDELKKFFIFGKELPRVNELTQNLYLSLNLDSESAAREYFKNYNISLNRIKEKFEIEVLWNVLIYNRFKNNLEINEEKLKDKIKNSKKNNNVTSYLLSEIMFKSKNKEDMLQKILDIKNNITDIGFENTASKFSLSDSAKYGGKIGWVKKNALSKKILIQINKLKIGEISEIINTPGGQLLLKLEDIKNEKILIDEKKELKNLIKYEKNKQLSNFSNIYFNKIFLGVDIDEK